MAGASRPLPVVLPPRTRFHTSQRIDASSAGRRKAKRQHARLLAWMVEAVLSGPPQKLGWLIAMQAFGAPDYPKVRVVTKNSVWYTLRSKRGPAHAWFGRVRAFAPTPYEGGTNWPIGSASQTERLRFSGLYSREKVAPGNFDWDSLSNPERSACWWDVVGVIYGHYVENSSHTPISWTRGFGRSTERP